MSGHMDEHDTTLAELCAASGTSLETLIAQALGYESDINTEHSEDDSNALHSLEIVGSLDESSAWICERNKEPSLIDWLGAEIEFSGLTAAEKEDRAGPLELATGQLLGMSKEAQSEIRDGRLGLKSLGGGQYERTWNGTIDREVADDLRSPIPVRVSIVARTAPPGSVSRLFFTDSKDEPMTLADFLQSQLLDPVTRDPRRMNVMSQASRPEMEDDSGAANYQGDYETVRDDDIQTGFCSVQTLARWSVAPSTSAQRSNGARQIASLASVDGGLSIESLTYGDGSPLDLNATSVYPRDDPSSVAGPGVDAVSLRGRLRPIPLQLLDDSWGKSTEAIESKSVDFQVTLIAKDIPEPGEVF